MHASTFQMLYTGLLILCLPSLPYAYRVNRHEIESGSFIVGGSSFNVLSPGVVYELNEFLRKTGVTQQHHQATKVQVFYRLETQGQLYYSEMYKRVKNRNSYTIAYESKYGANSDHCYGKIQYFFRLPFKQGALAVVQKLVPTTETSQHHFRLRTSAINSKLIPVNSTSLEETVIDIKSIQHKCLYVCFEQGSYIMHIPDNFIVQD